MQRPRVLVLTPTFPPTFGGIQALTHRVVSGWQRLDGRVVTLESPGSAGFDTQQRYPVQRVPRPALSHRLAIGALNTSALVAALRWRPDLVVSGHITVAPAARIASALLRVPYAQWIYSKEMLTRPHLARFAVRHAAMVLAVSHHGAELARELGAEVDSVQVVLPGVDVPLVVDDVPPPPDDAARPTVVFVARLRDPHKGLDVLIRAMSLVVGRIPGVRLVVIGDGPLRAEYERLASQAGLADIVEFVGAVDDEQRDKWLDLAHVFAMPSRLAPGIGGEGFGIVYLEAAAHGLPVVAGNVGGALDAVEHGVTGLLVDPTDSTEVAEAIISLLLDPVVARQLGAAGRSRAATLTWARCSEQVERLLLGLVSARSMADAGRQ